MDEGGVMRKKHNPYLIGLMVFVGACYLTAVVAALVMPAYLALSMGNPWFLILYPLMWLIPFLYYKMYKWDKKNGVK